MKLLHSMIRVKNEKKSIDFYCGLLGLKLGKRLRLEDCYLQYLTDENTNVQIELTINDELPQNGYNSGNCFGHFAFECDNIDEFDLKMKEAGFNWEIEPFKMDEINTKIGFLNDPDGNSIEIIEKAK